MATDQRRVGATAAEEIDRVLTREILRGVHAPGSNLPTVRELAEQFGVNPATVQRAVARLEAKGLIAARQGSGLAVLDPCDAGGLSLISGLLDAFSDDPERSEALLTELLELRRSMTVRLLTRHRVVVLDLAGELDVLSAGEPPPSPEQAAELDLALARQVVDAADSVMARAVLTVWNQTLAAVPDLLHAVYRDAAEVWKVHRRIVELLRSDEPGLDANLDALLDARDKQILAAYGAIVASRVTS